MPAASVADADRPDWASNPKRMRRHDGTLVEVYAIGSLAAALGKSSYSIRRWERIGVLPETPLVQAVRGGPPRRLFLRDQIEALVVIAEQEGLAGRKPTQISKTEFTARAQALYQQLFPEHV